MRIYNTLTNQVEPFQPVTPGKVSIYVCGPTTYNYIHIGNARPVIFFDVVRRYFLYKGYDVTFASNLTDLNDKIFIQAVKENVTEDAIAKKYSDAYLEDVVNLHSLLPDVTPRVTEYIPQIEEYVGQLIEKKAAYVSEGDVYFRVGNIPSYGQLSGQKLEDLSVGARIEINQKKENPLDFMLWKHDAEGVQFDAPFGTGRPGWHTECSCMIDDIFKGKIDIHGGGSDLRFPHHENERAQSVALHDHGLANIWMHNGRIDLQNTKMSKSLGNLIWVKDLLKIYDANAYRMFLLAHSYRQPVNYTEEQMNQYQKEYDKLFRTTKQLVQEIDLANPEMTSSVEDEFVQILNDHMDNDFSTPNVITELYRLIKEVNIALRQKQTNRYLVLWNTLNIYYDVLGIVMDIKRMNDEDKVLYLNWMDARTNKDFQEADRLRTILVDRGIV